MGRESNAVDKDSVLNAYVPFQTRVGGRIFFAMPTFQEFQKFDIRVGTVLSARVHPTARRPAFQLEIDFGAAGVKN